MIADLLLTCLLGGGLIFVIFVLCFNTTKVAVKGQKSKQNNKKKPKKKKKNKNAKKKTKLPNITPRTIVDLKPEIKMDEHEHLISAFRGHIGSITGVTWHQSGKYLFSASKDKYIYVWENPTNPQISAKYISSLFAEDGGNFAALHSMITPNCKVKETEDENPFVAYPKTANTIFAFTNGSFGLNSYEMKMNAKTNKMQLEITSRIQTEFFKEDIECMCVPESMAFLCVSGSKNTKIYFYDIKQQERRQKGTIQKMKIAQAPRNKSEMREIEKKIDKAMEIVDGGQFINYKMNISLDGNWLSIGSFKKDVRLWRINYLKPGKRDIIQEYRFGGSQLMCSLVNVHSKSVSVVTFSCCSKYMISAGKDGVVKVWDIVNVDYDRGHKPQMMFESDLKIGVIDDLIIDYHYDIAAVLNEERRCIYIYKFKYDKKKIKLHCTIENIVMKDKEEEKRINCVRFSPDSQYIAVGSNDFDVRVYKIPKKGTK